MRASVGYSGTPLAKKLGFKDGARVHVVGAPENYADLVDPLPDGVRFVPEMDGEVDLVHVFSTDREVLEREIGAALAALKPDGTIWASWPKRASKIETDITEDTIREIALPLGLVDVKVCAVDDTWSGLKLVIRRENRPGKR